MPDWFAITGAVANVATAFDLGYRYGPENMHQDAGNILQKVDEILKHSNTVLENHKDIMDDTVYSELKDKYRQLHWQMADESQGDRAIRDEIIRQSRILSQLYASRESRYDRAKELQKTAEKYHTSVLSASELAHLKKKGKSLAMFPDVQTPSCDASPKSYTSWFSVFGRRKLGLPLGDVESAGSSENSSVTPPTRPASLSSASTLQEGYIVAVTHVQDLTAQPADGQTGTMYRRMISFEGAGKRIDIIDPRHHTLSENAEFIDSNSLRDMTLLGEQLLSGEVPQSSVDITEASATPGRTLESAIANFRRMSVAQ